MTCSWNGTTMWYLLVPLIALTGIAIKYAIAAPLRRYLAMPVDVSDNATDSMVERRSFIADDWPGLTTEMADEWIRECRSDNI